MKVYSNYIDYKVERPIITIGAFDGVHLGHREILHKLCKTASEKNGESVVLTRWPHPRIVLDQDKSIKLLNTLDEKLALLEIAGVQHTVVLTFTEAFSKLSSTQFIENILVKKLNVAHLIVGFNHHFGKDREGNYDKIAEYAQKFGFTSEKLDAKFVEDEKVSSTLIRHALLQGKVELANTFLGYDYSITGEVVTGDKIGRTIGFPTANIRVNHDFKLIPQNGVYAVVTTIDGKHINGMMNIGVRPTIHADAKLSIEVNLFNFSENIYGREITVEFKHWIRNEMKFNSIDQLKQQIVADKEEATKILGR